MTKKELFCLGAVVEDIKSRADRLEFLQKTGNPELIQLACALREKNKSLAKELPEAIKLIESAESPAMRCALHMVCMEGCSWEEVAARLGRGTADSWKRAVHRFIDRKLEQRGME